MCTILHKIKRFFFSSEEIKKSAARSVAMDCNQEADFFETPFNTKPINKLYTQTVPSKKIIVM